MVQTPLLTYLCKTHDCVLSVAPRMLISPLPPAHGLEQGDQLFRAHSYVSSWMTLLLLTGTESSWMMYLYIRVDLVSLSLGIICGTRGAKSTRAKCVYSRLRDGVFAFVFTKSANERNRNESRLITRGGRNITVHPSHVLNVCSPLRGGGGKKTE